MRDFLDCKRQKINIGDYCLRFYNTVYLIEITAFTEGTYQFKTVPGSKKTFKNYGRLYHVDDNSMTSHVTLLKIEKDNPLVKVLCS